MYHSIDLQEREGKLTIKRHWLRWAPLAKTSGIGWSKKSPGFTLLETIIALTVGTLAVTALLGTLPLILTQPVVQLDKLAVERELQYVRYWLTYDGNRAETFVVQPSPNYGYFQWRDFTGESMVIYQAYYYYNAAATSLKRELKANGVSQANYYVAKNLLTYSSASFSWQPSQRAIAVTLSPTIQDAPAIGDTIRTTTLTVNLRPESEPLFLPPGNAPVPPPLPGSQIYYVSGNPSINQGYRSSGDGASLHDADGNYYVVSSVSIPGAKLVDWQAVSETITAPSPIGGARVRFAGKSSAQNVAMEFYIKDSDAGFPYLSTAGFSFTDTVDTSFTFDLDETALAYVNNVKVITVKVVGTASPTFDLSTDQVVFIASP